MKCNHCGSEWTTTTENKKATCPFCGKQLENTASSQPAARGRFQLSYDKTTLVQFLGDEKNVVIPSGVTRIGAGAFHGYGVETVYIPDGVTEIGDNCFNGCKQLREVRIPASVTHISDSAFKDTCKKKIIAEKDSYAWKKYAKPETENKPAATNTPAEAKSIKDADAASSSKPTEAPKKTVKPTEMKNVKETAKAQAIKKDLVVNTSMKNSNQATKKSDQSAILMCQEPVSSSQEDAWARALGYATGKRPWIVGLDLLELAEKKLIRRIAYVNDDNMLWYIINKTDNTMVKRAAVKNLERQDILRTLALYNNDAYVRELAAEKLPKGELISVVLQQAATLSRKMTPYTLEAFQKNIHLLSKSNSAYFKEISENYPSPGIRYLLRGNKETENCDGLSQEQRLRMQTPSREEMRQREEISHCRYMLDYVRKSAAYFLESCDRQSRNGESNHEKSYNFGTEAKDDAYLFASMLKKELNIKGFSSIAVSVEAQYHYNTWKERNVLIGYCVKASVRW